MIFPSFRVRLHGKTSMASEPVSTKGSRTWRKIPCGIQRLQMALLPSCSAMMRFTHAAEGSCHTPSVRKLWPSRNRFFNDSSTC